MTAASRRACEHAGDLAAGEGNVHRAVFAPAVVEEQVHLEQPEAASGEEPDVACGEFFPRPASAGNVRQGIDHRADRFAVQMDRRAAVEHADVGPQRGWRPAASHRQGPRRPSGGRDQTSRARSVDGGRVTRPSAGRHGGGRDLRGNGKCMEKDSKKFERNKTLGTDHGKMVSLCTANQQHSVTGHRIGSGRESVALRS